MTNLDKVKEINTAIAALPKTYHGLIEAERSWTAKNPGFYAAGLIVVGLALGAAAVYFGR
jgi:hypothetical protein